MKPQRRWQGGAAAGQYLDGLGQTDLAKLDVAQWQEFCETLFTQACADLARQAEEEVPF